MTQKPQLARRRTSWVGGHWRTPPYLDGQIAAIAVVNDLILVTNNTSDYADFQNLQLQNWFIP